MMMLGCAAIVRFTVLFLFAAQSSAREGTGGVPKKLGKKKPSNRPCPNCKPTSTRLHTDRFLSSHSTNASQ